MVGLEISLHYLIITKSILILVGGPCQIDVALTWPLPQRLPQINWCMGNLLGKFYWTTVLYKYFWLKWGTKPDPTLGGPIWLHIKKGLMIYDHIQATIYKIFDCQKRTCLLPSTPCPNCSTLDRWWSSTCPFCLHGGMKQNVGQHILPSPRIFSQLKHAIIRRLTISHASVEYTAGLFTPFYTFKDLPVKFPPKGHLLDIFLCDLGTIY